MAEPKPTTILAVLLIIISINLMLGQTRQKNIFNTRDVSSANLDKVEKSHLFFMREEEKLARDVYLSFAQRYPDKSIFNEIGSKSEQQHTDRMRDMLELYDVEDPNPYTNDLPDSIGIFLGPEWGAYFKEKFDALVSRGMKSEISALYVGAFIEELDMNDIVRCPEIVVINGYPSPCGLNYTDEASLKEAYTNLVEGSENHLRAFVRQIEEVEGPGTYKAQYLPQEEVDSILRR